MKKDEYTEKELYKILIRTGYKIKEQDRDLDEFLNLLDEFWSLDRKKKEEILEKIREEGISTTSK